MEDNKLVGNEILAILNSVAASMQEWKEETSKQPIDSDIINLKISMLEATGEIFKNI